LLRYWNDKEVIQELGEAEDPAVSEEATTSMENYGHDKAGNEDESIVHYYASVGDAKVGRTCL